MAFPKVETTKDPADLADYPFDFASCIPVGDAIAGIDAVTIEVDKAGPASAVPDLTVASQLYAGLVVTLWLEGGKPDWRYVLGVTVHTVQGRTFERRFVLPVAYQ